jgi:hypothetical protein
MDQDEAHVDLTEAELKFTVWSLAAEPHVRDQFLETKKTSNFDEISR